MVDIVEYNGFAGKIRLSEIEWFHGQPFVGWGVQQFETPNDDVDGYPLERGYWKIWYTPPVSGKRVVDTALNRETAIRRIQYYHKNPEAIPS